MGTQGFWSLERLQGTLLVFSPTVFMHQSLQLVAVVIGGPLDTLLSVLLLTLLVLLGELLVTQELGIHL